jgi:hypothetical protein
LGKKIEQGFFAIQRKSEEPVMWSFRLLLTREGRRDRGGRQGAEIEAGIKDNAGMV